MKDLVGEIGLPTFPLVSASRKELDVELLTLMGTIPEDIHGYAFFNSPVGNINSDGLPFPEKRPDGEENPDYGGPIFNGDGMVFRIHFAADGRVNLKSRIMKTPDYYADRATSYNSVYFKDKRYKDYPFKNGGITRMSSVLGVRNQLNTAFLPFKLHEQEPARLLVTFDSGRPYEIDTQTLELLAPMGYVKEWRNGAPEFLRQTFPVNMATAHPCFDPNTKELFIVNFIPSYAKMVKGTSIVEAFLRNPNRLKRKLEKLADHLDGELDGDGAETLADIQSFFTRIKQKIANTKLVIGIKKAIHAIDDAIDNARNKDPYAGEPNIFLMRMKNGENKWERYRLVDKNGLPVTITQSMHQIGLTKDHIVIMDTSFKMALDLMMTNPFTESAKIDRFIRNLMTGKMNAQCKTYLIRRSDLKEPESNVPLIELKEPVPMECVHFTTQYDNPNNEITFFSSHNNALCVAEWTREYDLKIDDPTQPVPKDMIGMYNGAMDVSGIGKFVIDATNAAFKVKEVKREMGDTDTIDGSLNPKIGPNTWSTGLYTYAGLDNPYQTTNTIRYVFWQNLGLDDKMLTDFVRRLYENYPHRIAPVEKIKEWVNKGIPGQIICVDTHTMDIVDYFQLPMKCQNRSIQFVPKKGAGLDPSKREGYIIITVLNPTADLSANAYTREMWIFDAENLAQGPVCKLGHPEWNFCYTIHSNWLKEVFSPEKPAFDYDIRADYQWRINKVRPMKKRKQLQDFMEQNVFPNFKSY